jgi:hypothetical protein
MKWQLIEWSGRRSMGVQGRISAMDLNLRMVVIGCLHLETACPGMMLAVTAVCPSQIWCCGMDAHTYTLHLCTERAKKVHKGKAFILSQNFAHLLLATSVLVAFVSDLWVDQIWVGPV